MLAVRVLSRSHHRNLSGGLSYEELSSTAAESYVTSSRRAETKSRLERLKKALALAENEHL